MNVRAGRAAERTVITGMSAATGAGGRTHELWKNLLAGESGLRRLSRFEDDGFPVRVVGEVPDSWVVGEVEPRLAVQTDRWTQLALALGDRALADAAVGPGDLPEYSVAVVCASSSGGNEFGQVEIEKLWSRGPDHVGPYQSIAWFYAATTGQLSIRGGFKGPCGVIATEQAGALDALGQARRVLGEGASAVVTGGTEAPISPYALTCQLASGALSTSEDVAAAYLPFDSRARGYVPGEGGAILVAESLDSAEARGAPHVYGELLGYASTFDGRGRSTLRRAIERALADAGVAPSEVDAVYADAVGTPGADADECAAIAGVFGAGAVPVTAPKALFGRLYSGGAAVDTSLALMSIRDGVLPPSGKVRADGRHPIDLVTEPREARVRTVLVLARGSGGFNAAVVLRGL